MYDIACMLVRHLKSVGNERIKFAIPSFHAYGHIAACQVSKLIICIYLHDYNSTYFLYIEAII